jgi:hypothetical protein
VDRPCDEPSHAVASLPRVRAASLALLAALALTAAGCGTDVEERNAYVGAVNEARAQFDAEVAEVSARLRETATAERTRKALADLQRASTRFEERLRGVQPPERVEALHGRLVARVDAYGEQFRRARESFRTEDPNAYLEARTEVQREVAAAGEQLNATIDELNAELRR